VSPSENKGFDLKKLAKLITRAPGPSPWYYGQQPPFSSDVGLLSWKQLDREGSVALIDTQGNYRLILSFYCYAMSIGPNRILVWYEADKSPPWQPWIGIEIFLLEIADLAPLEKTIAEAPMPRAQGPRVIFNGGLIASIIVPASLQTGLNRFVFPLPFRALDEILVLGDNTSIPGTSMKRSIYCLRPKDGNIEVLPQDWFNQGDFDFGYQWITKVVRDPDSGRISGTGIRLKSFILDESGCQVEQEFE
jgi:hypothetical protein